MVLKVHISYWKYETGEPEPTPKHLYQLYPTGFSNGLPKGWYCWAYPNDNRAFEEWMGCSCPTASITRKFNSGNPMYITRITNEKEAMLFQLAWVCS
jgi:hypothetical protein